MGVFWWFPKIIWSNLRTSHFSPATRRSPPAELRDMRVASQTFDLNQFPSSNCSTHPLQKPCSMMTRRLDPFTHINSFKNSYIHISNCPHINHPFSCLYIHGCLHNHSSNCPSIQLSMNSSIQMVDGKVSISVGSSEYKVSKLAPREGIRSQNTFTSSWRYIHHCSRRLQTVATHHTKEPGTARKSDWISISNQNAKQNIYQKSLDCFIGPAATSITTYDKDLSWDLPSPRISYSTGLTTGYKLYHEYHAVILRILNTIYISKWSIETAKKPCF